MDKDLAVNRVLRDFVTRKLIYEEDQEEVRVHLNELWVAGCECKRGTPSGNGRKIIQCDRQGKKIGDYGSIAEASRKLKIHRDAIDRSIRYKRITKRGHIWKYAENGDDQHQQE